MALSNDGIRPSRLELRLRFACGAVVGAALGALASLNMGAASATGFLIPLLTGSLLLGGLARRYGDRFWSSLHWWG